MEDSMISNRETRVIAESLDSTRARALPESKRARYASIISPTKFKGVVPQQNGHWGAQIYANHKRIWLGTFKSEKEAAMAYDSAAIRIRSADSHRNLPRTSTTADEPNFQSRHTTEEILNMIRDGSYKSKFAAFLRTEFILKHSKIGEKDGSLTEMKSHANGWLMFRQLFQKELTPSDVGKLNRLVIPKKYAMKYFPDISESGEESERNDIANDVLLVFYDKSMKLWNFRYCYWKSSQSFVFTRGWNRFVKENQLKADDTISFYICECRDKAKVNESFFMIDVNNNGENKGSLFEMSDAQYIQMQVALQLQLGQNAINDGDEEKAEAEEESTEQSPKHEGESKAFKLFGVRIF